MSPYRNTVYVVTYGTSAVSYQALRTIYELATIDGTYSPLAATILLNDTFVDDIFTGVNLDENILEYQSQIIKLCARAKFELQKWASNNIQVLQSVLENARAMSPLVLFTQVNNQN